MERFSLRFAVRKSAKADPSLRSRMTMPKKDGGSPIVIGWVGRL
jgi:hypothetical protein